MESLGLESYQVYKHVDLELPNVYGSLLWSPFRRLFLKYPAAFMFILLFGIEFFKYWFLER